MYDPNKLRGALIEAGTNGKKMAHEIGVSEMTFYRKTETGNWSREDIVNIQKATGWSIEKIEDIFLS